MDEDFDLAYDYSEGESALDSDDFDASDFEEDYEGDDYEDLEGDLDGLEGEYDGFEEDYEDDEDMFFGGDFEDSYDFEDEDSYEDEVFDNAIAYALASESEDEFFKKLWSGIKKVGKKIGRVVKKAAPFISRVASVLPIPGANLVGTAARVISGLRMEAEDSTDALEMAAEAAKKVPGATPVAIGLIARKTVGRKGKMMSKAARKSVAKDIRKAVTKLNKTCGPSGAQVAAQIAKRVAKKARGASPVKKAKVVKAIANKVARKPSAARALVRTAPVRSRKKAHKLIIPRARANVGIAG